MGHSFDIHSPDKMCARCANVYIIILMCAGLADNLKVIFERVRFAYLNDEYVQYAFINISRYERRGDYYLNYEFITKYQIPNNLMIHLLYYEFLGYRYERSFIECHHNLCDFLNDHWIGEKFRKRGLECPVKPGKLYSFKNLSIPVDDFPNVFPYEKGLIKIKMHLGDYNNTRIAEIELYLSFKNSNKGKKRN